MAAVTIKIDMIIMKPSTQHDPRSEHFGQLTLQTTIHTEAGQHSPGPPSPWPARPLGWQMWQEAPMTSGGSPQQEDGRGRTGSCHTLRSWDVMAKCFTESPGQGT